MSKLLAEPASARTSILLTPGLKKAAKAQCRRHKISLGQWVRLLLADALEAAKIAGEEDGETGEAVALGLDCPICEEPRSALAPDPDLDLIGSWCEENPIVWTCRCRYYVHKPEEADCPTCGALRPFRIPFVGLPDESEAEG